MGVCCHGNTTMKTYQHADDPPRHLDDIVATTAANHVKLARSHRQVEAAQEPREDLSYNKQWFNPVQPQPNQGSVHFYQSYQNVCVIYQESSKCTDVNSWD